MSSMATVSLCNNYARRQPWFGHCVGSWKHNLLPDLDRLFVSDGTLDGEKQREIEALSDGRFLDVSGYQQRLKNLLDQHPAIAHQREKCIFYRRIIDFSIYLEDYDYVVNLDTDIGVISPVYLDENLPDMAFCVDEVPGYSADPGIVFGSGLVTGLNAGFLLFRPQIVLNNLDFIETVTCNYIGKGKITWWSEQTLWAAIAANLCPKVKVFSPDSVAIVSGTKKRSIQDIRANKTRYFRPRQSIEDKAYIQKIIGDARVIHFAGPGKPWIEPIMQDYGPHRQGPQDSPPHSLGFDPLPPFPTPEKVLLYLRLLSQQVR